jgi:hypothetical protein
MGSRTYTFDANNGLSDGAAAYTASGYAQYAGADGLVDTGGNQNVTITLPTIAATPTLTPQQARIDCVIPIWITGIYTGGANSYKLLAVVSNDPAFGAGNVQIAGSLQFGTAGSTDVVNGITTPAPAAIGGDPFELLISTEQNNVFYEYVKLYIVIAGTTPSITFKAFLAVLMHE